MDDCGFFIFYFFSHHKSAAKANRKKESLISAAEACSFLIDARDINETFTLKKIKSSKYYSKNSVAMIVTVRQRMERREVQPSKAWSQLLSKRCFPPLHTCTLAKKQRNMSVYLNYCSHCSGYDSWSSDPSFNSQPV